MLWQDKGRDPENLCSSELWNRAGDLSKDMQASISTFSTSSSAFHSQPSGLEKAKPLTARQSHTAPLDSSEALNRRWKHWCPETGRFKANHFGSLE